MNIHPIDLDKIHFVIFHYMYYLEDYGQLKNSSSLNILIIFLKIAFKMFVFLHKLKVFTSNEIANEAGLTI